MTTDTDKQFTQFLLDLNAMRESEANQSQVEFMRGLIERELRKSFKIQEEKNKKKKTPKI